jgi:lysophospholipase L1-like esterase
VQHRGGGEAAGHRHGGEGGCARRLARLFVAVCILAATLGGCGDGTPVATELPKQEILIVGDSIAAGVGVTSNRESLQGRLADARPNWFIFNVSRGGLAVFGRMPGLQLSPEWLRAGGGPATNIVVMLGVNDYLESVPLATFRARYEVIAATATRLRRNLVCVTPIWTAREDAAGASNLAGLVLADYRRAITDVCTAHGFAVIDGANLVPHDSRLYAKDGTKWLHPNAAGYARLAQALLPQLDSALVHGAPRGGGTHKAGRIATTRSPTSRAISP